MPTNVRMPDGTIVQNVPDGMKPEQLMAIYNSKKAGGKPEESSLVKDVIKGNVGYANPAADIVGLLEVPTQGIGSLAKLATQGLAGPVGGAISAAQGKGFMPGYEKTAGAIENAPIFKSFEPETALGKKLTSIASLPGQGIQKLSDIAFEKTGSPLAATAVDVGLNAIPLVMGRNFPGKVGEVLNKTAEYKAPDPLEGMTPQLRKTVQQASERGLPLPPSAINNAPKILQYLEKVGVPARLQQDIQKQWNSRINDLTAQEVGIDPRQGLSRETIEQARQPALDVYSQIRKIPTPFSYTPEYVKQVNGIANEMESISKEYPNVISSKEVSQIKSDLIKPKKVIDPLLGTQFKNEMNPSHAMTLIQQLRSEATNTLKSTTYNPETERVAYAKLDAAKAIEGLVDANLKTGQNAVLYKQFQAARTQLAKTYDVESALNDATGNVDPVKLSRIDQRTGGGKLTGELKAAAQAASAFPRLARPAPTVPSGSAGKSAIVKQALQYPVRKYLTSKSAQQKLTGVGSGT